MAKIKLWMLAAILAVSGMAKIEAQDIATKKAAPKARVINIKGATADRQAQARWATLQGQSASVQTPSMQKTHTPGIAFRDALTMTQPKQTLVKDQPRVPLRHNGRKAVRPYAFSTMQIPQKAYVPAGEETNEYGIITSPASGVRKVYSRSGRAYNENDGFEGYQQTISVHVVECEDGTVYIRNILSGNPTGAWVKGTREGNTITVPAHQPVYYNSYANVTYSVRWGYNEGWAISSFDSYNDGVFTFTVDETENTFTLENSSQEFFIGLFWDDDDTFAWEGDYESVWTCQGEYQQLPVVTVSVPSDLETESWYTKGHELEGNNAVRFLDNVNIGFDGDAVYLKGLFSAFPDAWMEGTVDGDVVTFRGLQKLGTVNGNTYYAVGTDGADLTDFTMTWDEDLKVLTSQNQLLANADKDDIRSGVWMSDLTIQVENPNKPIDMLPYANAFDSVDEWESFTVIDANEDGTTWNLFDNNEASCRYHTDNDADDWLVSPAILLETGKTYSFSIDARCSSNAYSERIEVALLAANADFSPLTSETLSPVFTVIEPIEFQTEVPQTLANKFITVTETGYYHFGIHAISDADHSSLRVDNVLVDETILTAPAAVTDLNVTPDAESPKATITFTAPTKNLVGEDLTGNLTMIELLRDGIVITTFEDVAPGTAFTYVDDDPELIGTTYSYQVVAYNADGQGDKSAMVTVRLNMVFDIPYVADFTQDAVGGQFVQIDANGDNHRWEWDGGIHATYEYNSDLQADDYLISPALKFDAGQRYTVTVDAGSAGYTERFEILVGREATPDGLSEKVLEDCVVTEEDSKEFEIVYTAAEAGVYYVAIHCISDPDMYELWINKVTVDFAPAITAPAAPELTVTTGEKGAMETTVVIKAPSTTIGGDALEEKITKIELTRDGNVISDFGVVDPGATLTFSDTDVYEIGEHTYQAIPYSTSGIGQKSEKVTVYVGTDVPEIVTGVKAADHISTVLLTWDKVSETGVNGGYVNPDEVEYVVYACYPNSDITDEEVATVTGVNSCELDYATDEGEQGYQMWFVAARTEAGESMVDVNESAATIVTGVPYELPVLEGFAGNILHYYWDSNSYPLTYSQSSDDDGIALAMTSLEAGDIYLTSGKLNLNDAAVPTLLFDASGFGVGSVSVYGSTDAGKKLALATESVDNAEYKTVKVSLDDLKGGHFAQVGLTATIENPTTVDPWGDLEEEGDALVIDNIRIVDLVQHNLAVELQAPETVLIGKKATVSATVTNWGEEAASGFTVVITAGDQLLSSETVTDALAPFASRVFTAQLATTVFDEAGDRTVTVTVDYSDDMIAADNSAETQVTVMTPDVAPVENLMAETTADGVELNWDAPAILPVDYTENFDNTDNFPTFSIGGITESQHAGQLGEWTFYDGNGTDVYSWNDANVDYENRYMPSAFMPFDFAKAGFTNEKGYSGTQVMLSMCPVPQNYDDTDAADHWMISPELPGMEQEISFYLRVITDQYGGESFEVLGSTTDNQPDNFTLLESFTTVEEAWTPFYVTLPEGTKYFAIRHTSNDVFGIMVDDVTFNYAGSVDSYNVYCDGVLMATVEDGVTTYAVAVEDLTQGEHTFAVTAVYASGQESMPAAVSFNVVTAIRQLMADGQPVDVYGLDGKLVRSEAKSLDGLKGVYVINGSAVIIK